MIQLHHLGSGNLSSRQDFSLQNNDWLAYFYSHLPVGGVKGAVAQVSALLKTPEKQANKNTTSLVLSVQHSTTQFSFLFLTIMPKTIILIIIRSFFYLDGIEQTPHEQKNKNNLIIKASIPDSTRHLQVVLETSGLRRRGHGHGGVSTHRERIKEKKQREMVNYSVFLSFHYF